ncbi:MAG: TetR/AcrR family transcriptional regulator [Clostridiales bacterium]|nr:TetR/AcrR family transcriptional regulator [Clostridiales bacterium]
MDFSEAEVKVFQSTIVAFNMYGLKLTVDQIAKTAGISKKTVYRDFESKEDVFLKLVDYLWDSIKMEEEDALSEEGLTIPERLRKIMSAMPSWYSAINLSQLSGLRETYPMVYEKVRNRLETGWEPTIELIRQGQSEGVIRKDIDVEIVKMMMDASLERFFEEDILDRNNIRYEEGLQKVVDILLTGICEK